MDAHASSRSASEEEVSPTVSRFGRTRKPKITADFCDIDDVFGTDERDDESSQSPSPPPVMWKSPVVLKKIMVGKPPSKRGRPPSSTSLLKKLPVAENEMVIYMNAPKQISPLKIEKSPSIVKVIKMPADPLKQRKFFKSKPTDTEEVDFEDNIDVTKVMKIVVGRGEEPPQPEQEEKKIIKYRKNLIKTYGNKRKPSYASELESFGLPDEPIIPTVETNVTKPKRILSLDADKPNRDVTLLSNVSSQYQAKGPPTTTTLIRKVSSLRRAPNKNSSHIVNKINENLRTQKIDLRNIIKCNYNTIHKNKIVQEEYDDSEEEDDVIELDDEEEAPVRIPMPLSSNKKIIIHSNELIKPAKTVLPKIKIIDQVIVKPKEDPRTNINNNSMMSEAEPATGLMLSPKADESEEAQLFSLNFPNEESIMPENSEDVIEEIVFESPNLNADNDSLCSNMSMETITLQNENTIISYSPEYSGTETVISSIIDDDSYCTVTEPFDVNEETIFTTVDEDEQILDEDSQVLILLNKGEDIVIDETEGIQITSSGGNDIDEETSLGNSSYNLEIDLNNPAHTRELKLSPNADGMIVLDENMVNELGEGFIILQGDLETSPGGLLDENSLAQIAILNTDDKDDDELDEEAQYILECSESEGLQELVIDAEESQSLLEPTKNDLEILADDKSEAEYFIDRDDNQSLNDDLEKSIPPEVNDNITSPSQNRNDNASIMAEVIKSPEEDWDKDKIPHSLPVNRRSYKPSKGRIAKASALEGSSKQEGIEATAKSKLESPTKTSKDARLESPESVKDVKLESPKRSKDYLNSYKDDKLESSKTSKEPKHEFHTDTKLESSNRGKNIRHDSYRNSRDPRMESPRKSKDSERESSTNIKESPRRSKDSRRESSRSSRDRRSKDAGRESHRSSRNRRRSRDAGHSSSKSSIDRKPHSTRRSRDKKHESSNSNKGTEQESRRSSSYRKNMELESPKTSKSGEEESSKNSSILETDSSRLGKHERVKSTRRRSDEKLKKSSEKYKSKHHSSDTKKLHEESSRSLDSELKTSLQEESDRSSPKKSLRESFTSKKTFASNYSDKKFEKSKESPKTNLLFEELDDIHDPKDQSPKALLFEDSEYQDESKDDKQDLGSSAFANSLDLATTTSSREITLEDSVTNILMSDENLLQKLQADKIVDIKVAEASLVIEKQEISKLYGKQESSPVKTEPEKETVQELSPVKSEPEKGTVQKKSEPEKSSSKTELQKRVKISRWDKREKLQAKAVTIELEKEDKLEKVSSSEKHPTNTEVESNYVKLEESAVKKETSKVSVEDRTTETRKISRISLPGQNLKSDTYPLSVEIKEADISESSHERMHDIVDEKSKVTQNNKQTEETNILQEKRKSTRGPNEQKQDLISPSGISKHEDSRDKGKSLRSQYLGSPLVKPSHEYSWEKKKSSRAPDLISPSKESQHEDSREKRQPSKNKDPRIRSPVHITGDSRRYIRVSDFENFTRALRPKTSPDKKEHKEEDPFVKNSSSKNSEVQENKVGNELETDQMPTKSKKQNASPEKRKSSRRWDSEKSEASQEKIKPDSEFQRVSKEEERDLVPVDTQEKKRSSRGSKTLEQASVSTAETTTTTADKIIPMNISENPKPDSDPSVETRDEGNISQEKELDSISTLDAQDTSRPLIVSKETDSNSISWLQSQGHTKSLVLSDETKPDSILGDKNKFFNSSEHEETSFKSSLLPEPCAIVPEKKRNLRIPKKQKSETDMCKTLPKISTLSKVSMENTQDAAASCTPETNKPVTENRRILRIPKEVKRNEKGHESGIQTNETRKSKESKEQEALIPVETTATVSEKKKKMRILTKEHHKIELESAESGANKHEATLEKSEIETESEITTNENALKEFILTKAVASPKKLEAALEKRKSLRGTKEPVAEGHEILPGTSTNVAKPEAILEKRTSLQRTAEEYAHENLLAVKHEAVLEKRKSLRGTKDQHSISASETLELLPEASTKVVKNEDLMEKRKSLRGMREEHSVSAAEVQDSVPEVSTTAVKDEVVPEKIKSLRGTKEDHYSTPATEVHDSMIETSTNAVKDEAVPEKKKSLRGSKEEHSVPSGEKFEILPEASTNAVKHEAVLEKRKSLRGTKEEHTTSAAEAHGASTTSVKDEDISEKKKSLRGTKEGHSVPAAESHKTLHEVSKSVFKHETVQAKRKSLRGSKDQHSVPAETLPEASRKVDKRKSLRGTKEEHSVPATEAHDTMPGACTTTVNDEAVPAIKKSLRATKEGHSVHVVEMLESLQEVSTKVVKHEAVPEKRKSLRGTKEEHSVPAAKVHVSVPEATTTTVKDEAVPEKKKSLRGTKEEHFAPAGEKLQTLPESSTKPVKHEALPLKRKSLRGTKEVHLHPAGQAPNIMPGASTTAVKDEAVPEQKKYFRRPKELHSIPAAEANDTLPEVSTSAVKHETALEKRKSLRGTKAQYSVSAEALETFQEAYTNVGTQDALLEKRKSLRAAKEEPSVSAAEAHNIIPEAANKDDDVPEKTTFSQGNIGDSSVLAAEAHETLPEVQHEAAPVKRKSLRGNKEEHLAPTAKVHESLPEVSSTTIKHEVVPEKKKFLRGAKSEAQAHETLPEASIKADKHEIRAIEKRKSLRGNKDEQNEAHETLPDKNISLKVSKIPKPEQSTEKKSFKEIVDKESLSKEKSCLKSPVRDTRKNLRSTPKHVFSLKNAEEEVHTPLPHEASADENLLLDSLPEKSKPSKSPKEPRFPSKRKSTRLLKEHEDESSQEIDKRKSLRGSVSVTSLKIVEPLPITRRSLSEDSISLLERLQSLPEKKMSSKSTKEQESLIIEPVQPLPDTKRSSKTTTEHDQPPVSLPETRKSLRSQKEIVQGPEIAQTLLEKCKSSKISKGPDKDLESLIETEPLPDKQKCSSFTKACDLDLVSSFVVPETSVPKPLLSEKIRSEHKNTDTSVEILITPLEKRKSSRLSLPKNQDQACPATSKAPEITLDKKPSKVAISRELLNLEISPVKKLTEISTDKSPTRLGLSKIQQEGQKSPRVLSKELEKYIETQNLEDTKLETSSPDVSMPIKSRAVINDALTDSSERRKSSRIALPQEQETIKTQIETDTKGIVSSDDRNKSLINLPSSDSAYKPGAIDLLNLKKEEKLFTSRVYLRKDLLKEFPKLNETATGSFNINVKPLETLIEKNRSTKLKIGAEVNKVENDLSASKKSNKEDLIDLNKIRIKRVRDAIKPFGESSDDDDAGNINIVRKSLRSRPDSSKASSSQVSEVGKKRKFAKLEAEEKLQRRSTRVSELKPIIYNKVATRTPSPVKAVSNKNLQDILDDVEIIKRAVLNSSNTLPVKIESDSSTDSLKIKQEIVDDASLAQVVYSEENIKMEIKNEPHDFSYDSRSHQWDNIHEYEDGDLAYAKLGHFPYWPCLIAEEPSTEIYRKVLKIGSNRVMYHVRFFGDRGRRSWVQRKFVMPLKSKDDLSNMYSSLKNQGVPQHVMLSFKINPKLHPMWEVGLNEALTLLDKTVQERYDFFFDMFASEEEKLDRTTSPDFKKKEKLKASLVGEIKQEKPDDIHTTKREIKLRASPVKKLDANDFKKKEKFKTRIVGEIKQEKTDDIHTSKREIKLRASPVKKLDENEDFDVDVVKRKRGRPRKIMSPIYVEEIKQEIEEVIVEGKSGTATPEPKLKTRISLIELSSECSLSDTDSSSKWSIRTPVVCDNESQTALYKRNSLFKGVQRERVCQRCLKPGEVYKCRGKCCGYYHKECSFFKVKVNVEELEYDSDCQIVLVEDRKFKGPKNLSLSTDKSFRELSLAEQIDYKLEEVMLPMINQTIYADSTTDYTSSEDSSSEKNSELMVEHVTADDVILVNKSVKKRRPNKAEDDFKCSKCLSNLDPECFACEREVSPKNNIFRQKCSISACGKFYHPECLKVWPQTQISLHSTSKYKEPTAKFDSFSCPMHMCHICVSDDPRASISRLSSIKIVRCLKCPATYHSNTCCIPAGTDIVSTTQIICPRHRDRNIKGTKRDIINTKWCFICSEGGDLVCCETCPTSVHAECSQLNIKADDTFICEDCETGRLPLYDEIVWVKMGKYRWWPALILFPNDVPENIQNMDHQRGEFVVKFFGTHDHYWVSRGRVFLFQEGDEGPGGSKRRMDQVFKKAVMEAAEAHTFKTEFKKNMEDTMKETDKPPPYIRIKINKPVGNVKQFDGNVSNTTPCNCNPNSESPCGADSYCINRLLMTECDPEVCPARDKCQNQRFEKREYPALTPYKTKGRGWGLRTLAPIKKGDFVIEYVGEVIDDQEYQRRMGKMHEIKDNNYYFLTIDKDRMIDAGPKGNVARFMNHCCDPNCETQKWNVKGDTRVGLFAKKDIPENAEVTFNYNLESVGEDKKVCRCGAEACSGFIGEKVKAVNDEKKIKKLTKIKKKRSPTPVPPVVTTEPCFLCGESGETFPCHNKICTKYYHLKCVKMESKPESKWSCPWHNCNLCTKRTIRCCVKCINSYCPVHSEGNVRHDKLLGFICIEHDPNKEPQEVLTNVIKKPRTPATIPTEESDVTSTTHEEIEETSSDKSSITKTDESIEDSFESTENTDRRKRGRQLKKKFPARKRMKLHHDSHKNMNIVANSAPAPEVILTSSVPERHLRTNRKVSEDSESERLLKRQRAYEKDLPIRKRHTPRTESTENK